MTNVRPIRPEEAASIAGLWEEMCEAATERMTEGGGRLSLTSKEQIRSNLERTSSHPDGLCLVVEDEERVLFGFVTAGLTEHPIMPGRVGEVEELYVRPVPNQEVVRHELARQAIEWLKDGAGVIRVRVPSDTPAIDEEVSFWERFGLEPDQILLSLYL